MISQRQYIEALCHPEFHIRSLALRFSSQEAQPEIEVTRGALRAIDQFGAMNAFSSFYHLHHLAIDEVTLDWILNQLATTKEVEFAHHLLIWLYEKALVPQLEPRMAAIISIIGNMDEDYQIFATYFEKRIELYHTPAPQCLERLYQILEECKGAKETPNALIESAEQICHSLVERNACREELEHRVHEWLSLDSEKEKAAFRWNPGIAMRLAGLLKLESAIPKLIRFSDYDSDWWSDEINDALSRMKSFETTKLCAQLYRTASTNERFALSIALSNLFIPEAEPILTGLLSHELSRDLRLALATALAHVGTPSAQANAKAVYRKAPTIYDRFQIAEILYLQYTIEGIEDHEFSDLPAQMEDFRESYHEEEGLFTEDSDEGTLNWEDVVSHLIKIGRNDPCPCGSGKKYKKCCLTP